MARRRLRTEVDQTRGAIGKYRPEYCDRIYEFMATGASLAQFAALIGVAHETLNNWAEQRPEFAEAKKRAVTAAEAVWERKFTDAMYSKDVNTGMFNRYMAARFKWSDKIETDHRSGDGSMTPTSITRTVVYPEGKKPR